MLEGLPTNVRKVYEIIRSEGHEDVTSISKHLNISESTVRRALLVLEEKHLVRRYHGGASIVQPATREVSVNKRINDHKNEKKSIAKAAAAHIVKGDRIILTGGSTVAAICEFIKDIPDLTVITDSLLVINHLMYAKGVNLIVLGGILKFEEQCFEGYITTSNLKLFRASKMFLGVKGITAREGFLTDDIRQIDFYRECLAHSDQLIIVADSSKFYQEGITQLFSPSEVNLLITDNKAPKNIIKELELKKCKVEICE